MEKKSFYGVFAIFAVVWLALPTCSAATSEEAQRLFDCGMAAVEMAKTPEDYDLAIEEFKKAQALSPEWPEVYYNLGLIQEKAGKYKDAASSLGRYLQGRSQ